MPELVGLFRMRIHRQGAEVLVAVCDAALAGRDIRDGNLRLHLSEAFYGTETVDAAEVVRQLSACTIANLAGVDAVMLAIRQGYVHPDNVLDIGGVPHAQMCTS